MFTLPLYSVRKGPSKKSRAASGDSLLLPSEAGIGEEGAGGATQHLSSSEEPNSGPHACEASALTTELSRDR